MANRKAEKNINVRKRIVFEKEKDLKEKDLKKKKDLKSKILFKIILKV